MKNINNNIIESACGKIPPLWSLDNFVAVNPYLGFIDQKFEQAATVFSKTASINMTMPTSFYLEEYKKGNIKLSHLQSALNKSALNEKEAQKFIDNLINSATQQEDDVDIILIMDIAEKVTGINWHTLISDRITNWASSYFDKGQALWKTADNDSLLFESWINDALVDRTPEIAGLSNFRKNLKLLPNNSDEVIKYCLSDLDIPEKGIDTYLFSLLMKVRGWASYCAGLDWQGNLNGTYKFYTKEFLAVLLAWEWNLKQCLGDSKVNGYWDHFKNELTGLQKINQASTTLKKQLVLHQAYEYQLQENLVSNINKQRYTKKKKEVLAQAVFCIDVRSEVFRRNLEMVDQKIHTKGFAGFFGVAVDYLPTAHEHGEDQCPVLLHPEHKVKDAYSEKEAKEAAEKSIKANEQFFKAFKSFKNGAVTGFGFVSALGLTYVPKLFRDSIGSSSFFSAEKIINQTTKKGTDHDVELEISLENQLSLAKSALKTMSLTQGFAKFVLLVGHGSTSANNPHASGYDCGACGGKTGEVNAKVAAKILNNKIVRKNLEKEEIFIPEETIFVAALHNTTTDIVDFFQENQIPLSHKEDFTKIKESFYNAGTIARTERSTKFKSCGESEKEVLLRSKDWSQIRPEWGLAGCSAFVIAPRYRTQGTSLDSKSFLHDYNSAEDKDLSVLTTIMTAPMIVTSWINLQYYASTVDNEKLGAGNKTLHNVVGGFGVIEGCAGDLRVGLPLQSIHDGKEFQHQPSRLNVVIEAPIESINSIIDQHQMVKDLCDNNWIHLFAMNTEGKISDRYTGGLNWEKIINEKAEISVSSNR